jgi:metalloendopeptidase OMA1, mitochondrial
MHVFRTIAFLALPIFWLTGCTTVPETGRRQIIAISPAAEAEQGLAAFQQIKQETKVSANVMANDQVQRVGLRIAKSVGRALPNTKWEFVVFESDDVNAFALPGGKVGVYTGLLKLVASDDELACVMGHEIAHVTSRHGAERMTQSMGVALIGAAVEVGTEDSEHRDLWRGAYGVGTTLGMLGYSRLHESEADSIGLRFAAGAGYDPRAAILFWRKMAKASEGQTKPPEWMSTHPSDATRIANLERLAPQYLKLYEQSRDAIGHAEIDPAASPEIGRP